MENKEKEYQGEKINYWLVAWILGIIFGITALAIFCNNYSRGAKATNITWSYNNENITSNLEYDNPNQIVTDNQEAYTTPYKDKYSITGASINGVMTYNISLTYNYVTGTYAGNSYMVFSTGCTQFSTTNASYLDLHCTSHVGINVVTGTSLTITDRTSSGGATQRNYRIPSNITSTLYGSYNSISSNIVVNSNNTLINGYIVKPYSVGYTEGETAGYTNGYNAGLTAGENQGYTDGYSAGILEVQNNPNNYNLYTQQQYNSYGSNQYDSGRTMGRSDVTTNPNNYNLYTSTQYNDYGTTQYNAGVSNVTSNPNNYNLYTSTQYYDYGTTQYNAGITQGEQNVTGNPNNYNLYTSTQYNDYGTQQNDAGKLYVLNYFSTENRLLYGTSGTTYTTYTNGAFNSELARVSNHEKVFVLNQVAQVVYHGSGTNYTLYTLSALQSELSTIYNAGLNNNQASLMVLNDLAESQHGSGVTYTSYSEANLNEQADYIYNSGRLTGINQANSPNELTKFLPRMLAGFGGFLYPILTYKVFGISIMNFIVLFLGLGLLFIILKFVL